MINLPLAIVHQHRRIDLRSRPLPSRSAKGLLVAPLIAGLCGTDLQILRGQRHDPTAVLGHEGVVRIVANNAPGGEHLQLGQHVIINPTHPHDPGQLLGHLQDGLFQQRLYLPASQLDAGLVVPLPEDLPAPLAALIEPLASVIYGMQLMARHKRPGLLLVYGDGIIGHLAARCARTLLGAETRVVLIHHSLQGLHWSQKHATAGTRCVLRDDPGLDALLRMDSATAALLATPRHATVWCLEHALKYLADNAIIDLLGGIPGHCHAPSLPGVEDLAHVRASNCAGLPLAGCFVHTWDCWRRPRILFGHRGVSAEHLLHSSRWLASTPDHFLPLVTHQLSLSEAAVLMQRYADGHGRHIDGQRFLKVAITVNPCPAILKAAPKETSTCA